MEKKWEKKIVQLSLATENPATEKRQNTTIQKNAGILFTESFLSCPFSICENGGGVLQEECDKAKRVSGTLLRQNYFLYIYTLPLLPFKQQTAGRRPYETQASRRWLAAPFAAEARDSATPKQSSPAVAPPPRRPEEEPPARPADNKRKRSSAGATQLATLTKSAAEESPALPRALFSDRSAFSRNFRSRSSALGSSSDLWKEGQPLVSSTTPPLFLSLPRNPLLLS